MPCQALLMLASIVAVIGDSTFARHYPIDKPSPLEVPASPAAVQCTEYKEILARHDAELWELNQKIWNNPELSFKEVIAHDSICEFLEKAGYEVTRHAYGLETAFEASVQVGEPGQGGTVVYNAEYDALPDIGHACGHNLIASSSIAAFLATAEVVRKAQVPGCVKLLGTPAEEGGGGKIKLIQAGAYKGADACLMGHPVPAALGPVIQGVVAPMLIGAHHGHITYRGVAAHAGGNPWLGRNALDAAVQAYNNLSMLRQQVEPSHRIHAVINNGGARPNVIPDLSEMKVIVRAERFIDMETLVERVKACFQAAATATGCELEMEWEEPYKELRANERLAAKFGELATAFEQKYIPLTPTGPTGASTDQGNVSYELPSLHPVFCIPVEGKAVANHHPGFTKAGSTREAFDLTIAFACTLAATGVQVVRDAKLREEAHATQTEMVKKLLGDD
ncbi:hypothetical protein KEM52_003606 [Ascosphaera acerosa]|nr:hypothetical protein KEM52_003606 [Ascosphaera acerosa]